jgi:hypothetical protein
VGYEILVEIRIPNFTSANQNSNLYLIIFFNVSVCWSIMSMLDKLPHLGL